MALAIDAFSFVRADYSNGEEKDGGQVKWRVRPFIVNFFAPLRLPVFIA